MIGAQRRPELVEKLLEILGGAGHWPWIDHPAAIGRVTSFVSR